MKIEFTDGYIEMKESGNTYCGTVAHEFMHLASKFSRENGTEFNATLKAFIGQFWKAVDERVTELRAS